MNKEKIKNAMRIMTIPLVTFGIILLMIYLIIIALSNNDNVKEGTIGKIDFKSVYEELNNKKAEKGKKYREISIPEKHPFKTVEAEDIIDMIDDKESFVVYFGFPECPWCRSVLETLMVSARENNISKIYYVNVKEIRDEYKFDSDAGDIIKSGNGTEEYKELVEKLDNILEEYEVSNGDEKVDVGEKRIYAPNIITVVNGEAIGMTSGISKFQKDAYDKLTNQMKVDSKTQFDDLFRIFSEKQNENKTCDEEGC